MPFREFTSQLYNVNVLGLLCAAERKAPSKERIIIDFLHVTSDSDASVLKVYKGGVVNYAFPGGGNPPINPGATLLATFQSAARELTISGQNLFVFDWGETAGLILQADQDSVIQAGGSQTFTTPSIMFSGRIEYQTLIQRQPSHSGLPLPGTGIRPPANRKPTLLQRIADKIDKGFKKGGL